MFSIKELWSDLIYSRKLIWLSTIIFLIAILIGFTNRSLAGYMDAQMKALSELADIAAGAENQTLAFILIIFINNAVKCALVIFLGIFFGIYPLFFIVMNGLIIGYLLQLSAYGHLQYGLFDTIVKGLLPHGILEIPALIIATAYGLRMGRLVWRTIRLAFDGGNSLRGIGLTYKGTMKRAAVMTVYLTIILAIAALIESTVTVWLLSL